MHCTAFVTNLRWWWWWCHQWWEKVHSWGNFQDCNEGFQLFGFGHMCIDKYIMYWYLLMQYQACKLLTLPLILVLLGTSCIGTFWGGIKLKSFWHTLWSYFLILCRVSGSGVPPRVATVIVTAAASWHSLSSWSGKVWTHINTPGNLENFCFGGGWEDGTAWGGGHLCICVINVAYDLWHWLLHDSSEPATQLLRHLRKG